MDAIKVIADYGDLCGEGPLWDWRNQVLYWTDITGRRFYRYSWAQSQSEVISEGFELGGFALRESGGFVVVNSQGIWLWDGASEAKNIAEEADGKRCVLNDCVADPMGRLFTGSCFYDSANDNHELGCLFRMDLDRSVHIVDEGIRLSNGIGFSPDESTMYYVDSAERTIYAYDYAAQSGALRNRRVLVKVPQEKGVPDGLTVDSEGFIWCAQWFGSGAFRYDPDGKLERYLAVPATQTSSLTFGGPNLTDIFITSAGAPDALPLAPSGYNPDAVQSGGSLYLGNVGIKGREEYLARIA